MKTSTTVPATGGVESMRIGSEVTLDVRPSELVAVTIARYMKPCFTVPCRPVMRDTVVKRGGDAGGGGGALKV